MEMKYIHVNTEATERSEHGEVTVETGVNTGELIQEVEKQNRLVNVGSCPSVSPGGFIAGGGYGLLSPSLGLAVDNVLEIKVVLADGRVATCTQNNTIGVVVHYVLKLYPTTNNFVSVLIRTQLYLNDSDEYIIKKFMDAYDVWVRTAPSSWGGVIGFRRGTLYAILVKLGLRDGNTESELKPFYDFQRTLSHQSHVVSINLGNHTKLGDIIQDDARYASAYRTGALIPPKKHNESLWDFLAQEIMDANNRKIEVVLYLIRLGGKVSEYDVTSSSVHDGFRRAQSHLAFYFKAPTDRLISSIEELERQEKNAAQFAEKIRKFGDGDYFNVGYIPSPNWKLDFWGAHYVDLLVVKIRYDPGNLFSCYHCVGSDRTDFDDMFESSRASATIPEYVSTVLLLIATLIHVY